MDLFYKNTILLLQPSGLDQFYLPLKQISKFIVSIVPLKWIENMQKVMIKVKQKHLFKSIVSIIPLKRRDRKYAESDDKNETHDKNRSTEDHPPIVLLYNEIKLMIIIVGAFWSLTLPPILNFFRTYILDGAFPIFLAVIAILVTYDLVDLEWLTNILPG